MIACDDDIDDDGDNDEGHDNDLGRWWWLNSWDSKSWIILLSLSIWGWWLSVNMLLLMLLLFWWWCWCWWLKEYSDEVEGSNPSPVILSDESCNPFTDRPYIIKIQ